MKKHFYFLAIALILAACASLTSPNGGPKDIAPPMLKSSNPEPNQLNFKGKVIELEFDEYVQLKNPKEEIIISPKPGNEIEFKAKGTKVTIVPKDGWHDSTTYSVQFRDAIEDITEKNSPPNLKLAFSTGPEIDSLQLNGIVTETLKGTAQDNITVAIYQQDTFDIFSHKPSYFTKTDKKGKFSLTNIKAGVYKIYAFDDKNKNLKVESRSERFGFLTTKLWLRNSIDSISLGLVKVDAKPLKINNIRNAGSVSRLRFNKYIISYSVKADSNLVHAFSEAQDEIIFWNPPHDSILVNLTATDSVGFSVDSAFFIKKTDARTITDKLKWSLGRPLVESETGKFTTTMSFSKPVETINFDSLYIEIDTTVNRVAIDKKDLLFDLPHKEIKITKELNKEIFKGDKDPVLNLKAGAGFVRTIDNDTTRRLSAHVSITWPEDTGILMVNVSPGSGSYILQLVTNEGSVIAAVPNALKYTFKNVPPGDYKLRVILDINRNGAWDPGNIYLGQEAEKIVFYKAANGKESFPVRANWELGPLPIRF